MVIITHAFSTGTKEPLSASKTPFLAFQWSSVSFNLLGSYRASQLSRLVIYNRIFLCFGLTNVSLSHFDIFMVPKLNRLTYVRHRVVISICIAFIHIFPIKISSLLLLSLFNFIYSRLVDILDEKIVVERWSVLGQN